MSGRSLAQALAWFDAGAAALSRVTTGTPSRVYACPLCRYPFVREAVAAHELTMEHVPAGRLGGRELVLTCRRCNNTAGSALEADAVRLDNAVRFAQREPNVPLRTHLLGRDGYV